MGLVRRISNLFRRSQIDREISAELEAHIALRTEENIASGMTPEEARRDARVRFGNQASARERTVAVDAALKLYGIVSDIRYACRQLRRNPGFAITAIVVLALGMAASISIFAFVDAALIQPLPYRNPSRLMAIFESMSLGPQFHISYLDYLDWKRLNKAFASLDVYTDARLGLSTPSGTESSDCGVVSAGFFHTLGVKPLLGRAFVAGEDLPGAPRSAILSYETWQKRYGSRKDVLGSTVTLNNIAYTIVGVLPSKFHFVPLEPVDFWLPLLPDDDCAKERSCHNYAGIARLKDGITEHAAEADLSAIANQLARQYPDADANRGATVLPLSELILGNMRPILSVLLCGVMLLMLIACVNVASLLLVRSEARKREIAVRGALGASSTRLLQQLTTEGLALAVCSAVLALAAARLAMTLLLKLVPESMTPAMPYLLHLRLNLHVLAFACTLAAISALLFCIVPAIRLARIVRGAEMRDALATGGRGFVGSLWRRFGSHLVAIEIATATVLLVGAGLLSKSFYRLLHTDIGLHPEHVAALDVAISSGRYPKNTDAITLRRNILEQVANLPGMQSVGSSGELPVGTGEDSVLFRVMGRPYHGEHVEVLDRDVDPGYFPTIGARLLRGRYFTKDDGPNKPPILIINEALVRKYFPGEDPIGKKISTDEGSSYMQVVGIVDDIKEGPLDTPTRPALYVPIDQDGDGGRAFFIVARTRIPEQEMLPLLASTIKKIDPGLVLSQPTSMPARIHDSPAAYLHRASAWLVGCFAAIALLLGAVGLYGVIAYSVSQRTREIGVRIALGAQRGSVYRMILREAGWLAATGISLGLVGSLFASALMRKLLYGTQAWDIATLMTVTGVMAVATLLASLIPARRAASVNPIEALRAE